jgi:hypothetical protein
MEHVATIVLGGGRAGLAIRPEQAQSGMMVSFDVR